ncbi:hypothetical protein [Methanobrevibacter smithii]
MSINHPIFNKTIKSIITTKPVANNINAHFTIEYLVVATLAN